MRCRNCGQLIENGSRFCTYCDCDNYPEMNRVKTKNTHSVAHLNNTYKAVPKNNMQPKTKQNSKKKSGCVPIVVIIIIIYILLMMVINLD